MVNRSEAKQGNAGSPGEGTGLVDEDEARNERRWLLRAASPGRMSPGGTRCAGSYLRPVPMRSSGLP